MTRTGRQPQVGLEPRPCENCGKIFQPYRSHQIACSRPCRDKTKEASPRRQAYALVCKGCGTPFSALWTGMGRQPSCESCTAAFKRASDERKNEARRGTPRVLAYSKDYNFRKYGLTRTQYDAMFEAQGGVCAICRQAARPTDGPSTKRLHIDHDHKTGVVRALLCASCNRGLGYFFDSYELLLKAAAYLERFEHGTS